MMKLLILLLLMTSGLHANPYLSGKIVDIGTSEVYERGTAPMVWKNYAADYEMIEDLIRSKKRILSRKTECFTDNLGSSVCPLENAKCTITQDTIRGTSTALESAIYEPMRCPSGTLMIGDKCYLDVNNNRVADIKNKSEIIVSSYFIGDLKNNSLDPYMYVASSPKCSLGDEKMISGLMYSCGSRGRSFGWWKTRARYPVNNACVDQEANILVTESETSLALKFAGSYGSNIGKNCSLGWRDIFSFSMPAGYSYQESKLKYAYSGDGCHTATHSDLNLTKDIALRHSACTGGGAQALKVKVTGDITIAESCPIGYATESLEDYNQCYIPASCQLPYIENSDGRCEVAYTYFDYSCPVEFNYYEHNYNATDEGIDCKGNCPNGMQNNCFCNDPSPEPDNCTRTTYNCMSDLSKVCTKMEGDGDVCENGYHKVNGRCQRDQKYCGENIYNHELDSCMSVIEYEKECSSRGDIFNKIDNICESTNAVCVKGTYNQVLNKCVSDTKIECVSEDYTYNEETKQCENPDAPKCIGGDYIYVTSRNLCVAINEMCESGFVYNESKHKCVRERCETNTDREARQRCEIDANLICDGTITATGKCIPDNLFK